MKFACISDTMCLSHRSSPSVPPPRSAGPPAWAMILESSRRCAARAGFRAPQTHLVHRPPDGPLPRVQGEAGGGDHGLRGRSVRRYEKVSLRGVSRSSPVRVAIRRRSGCRTVPARRPRVHSDGPPTLPGSRRGTPPGKGASFRARATSAWRATPAPAVTSTGAPGRSVGLQNASPSLADRNPWRLLDLRIPAWAGFYPGWAGPRPDTGVLPVSRSIRRSCRSFRTTIAPRTPRPGRSGSSVADRRHGKARLVQKRRQRARSSRSAGKTITSAGPPTPIEV